MNFSEIPENPFIFLSWVTAIGLFISLCEATIKIKLEKRNSYRRRLENNPAIYKEFMNILNKSGDDYENFIKAYDLFANYIDDETKVKKIDVNTLILTGSDDPGSTSEMSRELNNDIPKSKFIEIKGGKHLCSIEFADDVNNAIKEHIKNEQN